MVGKDTVIRFRTTKDTKKEFEQKYYHWCIDNIGCARDDFMKTLLKLYEENKKDKS